jgi:predicted RND superfamily exporter protein
MKHLYNSVLNKSGISIVLLLLIIGFFIVQIPNFQLDASSDSLVLEGDNNLHYYQNVKKNYGSDDYLVISYQVKDNLLAQEQINHLTNFRQDLQAIEQVKSVTTILDVPLFRSPPLSLVDLASKNISNPCIVFKCVSNNALVSHSCSLMRVISFALIALPVPSTIKIRPPTFNK